MSGPQKETFVFEPAVREEIAFKCTLSGPAGSGKTLGALFLAYGIVKNWSEIAFADTENGSGRQYAGQTIGGVSIPSGPSSFMHCDLTPPYDPERMINFLEFVEAQTLPNGQPRFKALIFDNLSHTWQGAGGVLERVDQIGKLDGWKRMGPLLRKMIDAIRFSRLHFISTLRTKTAYQIDSETTADGKQKIKGMKKIGLEPVMRDGIDYEFTTCFRVGLDHEASVEKDRTNLFDGRPPTLLTPEHGDIIAQWCNGAACQIGSAEWVALREKELAGYGGTLDGLVNLWRPVSQNRGRVKPADYARLTAAKDASKERLQSGGAAAPPAFASPGGGL